LTGRLGKTGTTGALDLYAQLQRTGASSDVLADARDYLAYGYLKNARQARFVGDRQRAADQLTAARNFQPSATIQGMLTAEQQLLTTAADGANAQQASEIDAARGRFAQSLRSTTLGPTELSTIALALAYAILVPPVLVLVFVAIMVFESEYTHLIRVLFFGAPT